MKFKLDENLSRWGAELFRTRGHDAMTMPPLPGVLFHQLDRAGQPSFCEFSPWEPNARL